jgi:hypothetical protein
MTTSQPLLLIASMALTFALIAAVLFVVAYLSQLVAVLRIGHPMIWSQLNGPDVWEYLASPLGLEAIKPPSERRAAPLREWIRKRGDRPLNSAEVSDKVTRYIMATRIATGLLVVNAILVTFMLWPHAA